MNTSFPAAPTNLKIIKACDSLLFYIPEFLGQSADKYYKLCANLKFWQQETISIFGKKHLLPRLTIWLSKAGHSYHYSGIEMLPKCFPKPVEALSNNITSLSALDFNGVLLNKYRDGADKVGWHRDNEKCLGEIINIATISLGAARPFKAKHSGSKETFELVLGHGSLLLMMHPFQRDWLHCLPARPNLKIPRISLTFRKIKDSWKSP